MAELEGRVAVVTGGSRGIGRAIVAALLARGASVTVSGRDPGHLRALEGELEGEAPGRALGVACDVRIPAQCQGLVEAAVERFGRLDILVNNAGLGRFAPIQEMGAELWEEQLRTNLDGVFYMSKAAIPHLIGGGGGWILNIGSLAGKNAFAGGAAYNASKFGLLGLSEAMMLDLRAQGVRVSCIMPGSVNTGFFPGGPDPAQSWRLEPEDVAQVVVDLLGYPERALPSRVEIRPSRPPGH